MAAAFCSYCGYPLISNATFCTACGAAVGGSAPPLGPPAASFPPPPPGTSYYSPYARTYLEPGDVPAGYGPGDQVALLHVSWAAILGLVGAALSMVELVFTPAFSFLKVTTTATGSATLSVSQSGLALVVAVGALGFALTVAELFLYRRAFAVLRNLDRKFSAPATFVLLALAALGIVFLVAIGFLSVISQAITCAGPGNPITSACLNVGSLLGLVAVLVIAAIVAFMGFIGLLIGIWRLGTRYNDTMFKVGAVLLIFPVLNVVGLILILVGARSAGGSLRGTTSPMPFGL